MPTLAQLQAKAEAEAQLTDLQALERDDVVTGEERTAFGGMGLGATPVQATNGANTFVTLYHAYDGRKWSGPMYMVGDRLTVRFRPGDGAPPEFLGKQVWLPKPPETQNAPRPFLCRLSVDQTDEVKAQMTAAGFQNTCRKPGGFATQFDADEHFRKKHPRRWAAYERYAVTKRQTDADDRIAALLQAVVGSKEK